MLAEFFKDKLKSNTEIQILEIDGKEYVTWRGFHFAWKKRAYYRHINAKVYPDLSMTITTGKKPPMAFIEKFLKANEAWLLESLEHHAGELRTLQKQKLLPRPEPGGWVPFLGHALRLEKATSKKQQGIDWDQKTLKIYPGRKSFLSALFDFYKAEAKKQISKIQKEVSDKMGLYPTKLNFRKPKTQWGNCNSKGEITYNWKLIAAPYRWVEYVVVHETSHLKHMDHSAKFWALVATGSPDFKKYANGLKKQQNIFEFLNERSNLYTNQFHFNLLKETIFDENHSEN